MMGFQTFYCKEILHFNSYIISSCYFLLHCCYVALIYEGHALLSVIKVFCNISVPFQELQYKFLRRTSFYQEQ